MATPRWRASLFNALRFEAGWLACVMGGSWVAAGVGIVLIGWHLGRCAAPGEWRFIALFTLVGGLVDGTLHLLGGFDFNAQGAAAGLLPLWLWMLWPLFATLVLHSLDWLWRWPLLAAGCGALSAPLSYWGGAAIANVELASWLLPGEALIWAVICYAIARWHSGRPA